MDVELRHRIEAHINECPNCFVILDTTKSTIQVYKGVQAQPLPDDVQARLMKAVERKMRRQEAGRDALAGCGSSPDAR